MISPIPPILPPLLAYLALTLGVALWAGRHSRKRQGQDFVEEYFIGGRSLGGFVLAMTIVASYTSASSFVGGPGFAHKLGLSWILLAMIQVPTVFLTIGVLGKRFAIVARHYRAVTISDFLRARYRSRAVATLCAIFLLVFFVAAMLAQFIGGARLFQSVTGHSYHVGLALFGLLVVLYTSIGGFRAVVLTDALQGVVMLVAAALVLVAVVSHIGGVEKAMHGLTAIDPGLITPYGPGNAVPQPFILSFWILVGLGVLGLPQTAQRCMAYKNTQAMHQAMVMGTVIMGFLLLALHLVGALGRVIVPDCQPETAIPTLVGQLFPPVWAGIFIAGPVAAIMSTVDTMLLLASAALIKDLYIEWCHAGDASLAPPRRIRALTICSTLALGLLVCALALDPPDLLVWINLFAFGGLEAAFCWPLLLGLYWSRANATGALCSSLVGVGSFLAISILKPPLGGVHAIVPSLLLALLAFLAGNAAHGRFRASPQTAE